MKKLFTIVVFICCGVCSGVFAFAQTTELRQTLSIAAPVIDTDLNIILARSSADYRVTPGDIYALTYAVGTTATTYTILVDSSYRIRVANLGIVNGAGKTFTQLRAEAEAIVSNNYPLSGVQLVLTQPALFRVHIKGEVSVAEEITVWALNRLSSLVSKDTQDGTSASSTTTTEGNTFLAPSSISLRDISIRSANGQTRVYDLFKAQRFGDLSQDPYLRPGDEITFNRVKRAVMIDGEVQRPDTYQLLDGENVNELITLYGDGFTPIADKTRIELVRRVQSADVAGDKIFLTENDFINNYALENYDVVTVPVITQLQPVVFVEGAVVASSQMLTNTADALSASGTSTSNRMVIQFNKGETYASLVRRNVSWFTSISDTQNAYITRNDERIPLNLNPMLYDASYRGDVLVHENDVLIIPFRQYFVTVAGAVAIPGRYPYIPDRDWDYYIALAGGFAAGSNTARSVTITDIAGTRLKKTDAILPETTITASTNHPLYFFNLYAPVITTVFSLITTFFTVQAVLTR